MTSYLFIIVLAAMNFLCPRTNAQMKDSTKAGVRQRVSVMGRLFYIALPKNVGDEYSTAGAELTFMTYSVRSTVTVIMPSKVWGILIPFQSSTLEVTFGVPAVMPFSILITSSGTGTAARIVSTEDIAVLCYYLKHSTDMFMLPPVTAYSYKYVLQSPGVVNSLMTIAAHEMTSVRYRFNQQADKFNTHCSYTAVCASGADVKILLNASTFSHVITEYVRTGGLDQSLTGTRIDADKPVLVIVGSRNDAYGSIHYSTEPFLPVDMWGTAFFVVTAHHSASNRPYGLSIASVVKTVCTIHSTTENYTITSEPATGDVVQQVYFGLVEPGIASITCTKPVSLMVYSNNLHDAKTTYIQFPMVPVNRWPNVAQFAKLMSWPIMEYILSVAIKTESTKSILHNGQHIQNSSWKSVKSLPDYRYLITKIDRKYTYLHTLQPNHYFFAFVIAAHVGSGVSVALGTHLGAWYNLRGDSEDSTYACKVNSVPMTPGDNIDNDCDGEFDEEMPNGKDDDGDKLIDEDVFIPRENGSWGIWQTWYCDASCEVKGIVLRKRACDNPQPINFGLPCKGNETQTNNSTCPALANGTCPASCPAGSFLPGCDGKCPISCHERVCDRLTGECFGCEPGYQPSKFCDMEAFLNSPVIPPRYIIIRSVTPIWKIIFPVILLLLVICFIAGIELGLCSGGVNDNAEEEKANEGPDAEQQPEPELEPEPVPEAGTAGDEAEIDPEAHDAPPDPEAA